MDNIIQIEMLRYAKICGKKTLFHDLTNSYSGKSENPKPLESLLVFLLLLFSFQKQPPKSILGSSYSKNLAKFHWKTGGGFLY